MAAYNYELLCEASAAEPAPESRRSRDVLRSVVDQALSVHDSFRLLIQLAVRSINLSLSRQCSADSDCRYNYARAWYTRDAGRGVAVARSSLITTGKLPLCLIAKSFSIYLIVLQ